MVLKMLMIAKLVEAFQTYVDCVGYRYFDEYPLLVDHALVLLSPYRSSQLGA